MHRLPFWTRSLRRPSPAKPRIYGLSCSLSSDSARLLSSCSPLGIAICYQFTLPSPRSLAYKNGPPPLAHFDGWSVLVVHLGYDRKLCLWPTSVPMLVPAPKFLVSRGCRYLLLSDSSLQQLPSDSRADITQFATVTLLQLFLILHYVRQLPSSTSKGISWHSS